MNNFLVLLLSGLLNIDPTFDVMQPSVSISDKRQVLIVAPMGSGDDDKDHSDDTECMEVVEYEIQIGSSSRDIRLTQTIQFQTGHRASTLAIESYPPKTTITTTTNTTCTTNTNNNDSSSTPRSFLVEDDVFAKRFIGGAFGVGVGVGVGGNDTDKISDFSTSTSTSTILSRMKITSTSTSTSSSRNSSNSIPLVQVITRNTLLVDASSLSWIGSLLLFISLKVAQLELHKDDTTTTTTTTNESSLSQSSSSTTTTKKRELRLIRANVENLPLRGLVSAVCCFFFSL